MSKKKNNKIESIESQIESQKLALANIKENGTNKKKAIEDSVANRFQMMEDMWGSSRGVADAAMKLRVFEGDGPVDVDDCVKISAFALEQTRAIKDSYEKANGAIEDYEKWLDEFCVYDINSVGVVSKLELCKQLVTFDVCQGIWEFVRRIPEFKAQYDEQVASIEESIAELDHQLSEFVVDVVPEE